jgi:hypothetical protein
MAGFFISLGVILAMGIGVFAYVWIITSKPREKPPIH